MEANERPAKRKLPRSFLTQKSSEPEKRRTFTGFGRGRSYRGRGRGAFTMGHTGNATSGTAASDAQVAPGPEHLTPSNDAPVASMPPEASRARRLPSTFAASTGRTLGGTAQGNGASRTTPSAHSEADTKAALRAALQGLELCGKDEREPPEGSMTLALMRHQRLALDWMLRREAGSAAPVGGILADDQGLGKTVTTIALILTAPAPNMVLSAFTTLSGSDSGSSVETDAQSSDSGRTDDRAAEDAADSADSSGGDEEVDADRSLAAKDPWEKGALRGGTLIVVPTSVLHQWHQELKDKVATFAGLRTHVYHGKSKAWTGQELARYGVVLTTYAIMGLEAPPPLHGKKGLTENKERRPCPLFEVDWHRVILDEAQSIKNAHTLASHASRCLQTSRRWCLTGTPIQNTVDDLYSYFRFLRYEPYSRQAAFKSMLKEPLQSNPKHGSKLLRAALQGVLLRRTKGSTLNGEPIVELPARQVEVVRLHFSAGERAAYDELQRSSMSQLKAMKGAKTSYMNMLLLLLRLRQACNHPWLASGGRQSDASGTLRDDEVSAIDASLRDSLLIRLEQPDSSLCGICGDVAEEPAMTPCAHSFCRQCLTTQVGASGGAGEQSYKCPTCSATIKDAQVFSHAALLAWKARLQHSSTAVSQAGTAQACSASGAAPASSKIEKLLSFLAGLRQDSDSAEGTSNGDGRVPAKVIVFSQWTRMLDLIQSALQANHIRFSRLDGTLGVSARSHAVAQFNANKGTNVLLVSLKAASLGLNLTAASYVVLMDLWWNPSVEEQAIDRAHRIGQTRTVRVMRLTIADTVEDRILALQEKKRKLAEAALGDGDGGVQASRLTMEDLQYLFSAS